MNKLFIHRIKQDYLKIKKPYGKFSSAQTRKEYHMALKKLLKSILNVNCIKIKNVEFNQISSSLHIHVEITKGQRSRCPVCSRKCSGYDSTTERRAEQTARERWKIKERHASFHRIYSGHGDKKLELTVRSPCISFIT